MEKFLTLWFTIYLIGGVIGLIYFAYLDAIQ